MRLIDADALMEEVGISNICEDCKFDADPFCDLRGGSVCRAIRNAPTIEATPMQSVTTIWTDGEPPVYAPIRHGHWIEDLLGDCCYKCSECGFVRDAYLLEVETYCPNCGAKMDEVSE